MAIAEPTQQAAPATAAAPGRAPRGDIQGLRAVAVGTVVLSHAGMAGLAGGYVGVDVFFVISGFLITGILVREVGRTGGVSVLDFYARRARRILPAASVTLLGITIWSWLAFGYVRLTQVLHDIVWASLFGANIDFARSETDYFAQDTFLSPVQHFWSLAVEEQFYLLWPALIAVVALLGRGRVLRTVALTLVGLCALSFAWCLYRTADLPTSAYFSTFTRGWELGAGALLALGARYLHQLTRGFLAVLSWIGLAMIAWSCVTYTTATPFPGKAAVVPVLGAFLVLAGGVRPTPSGASLVLDRAPMRWLGDISYSLYLVHWPILTIPAMVAGHELSAGRRALLVALSVGVAWLSYRYVETPFREGHVWQRSRRRALALWPAAVGVVLLAVTAVGATTGGATAAHAVLDPDQNPAATDVKVAVANAVTRAKAGEPIPKALTPSPLALKDANWKLPAGCWAGTDASSHRVCSFGDTSATRTLVLYGDSHVGMWAQPIFDIAKASGWKVDLFLKTGCPPIDTPMWRAERASRYVECDRYRTWAGRQIARIDPERIVITGYTQSFLADPDGDGELDGDTGAAGTAALRAGMRPALERLRAITPHITVLSDTWTNRRLPADCVGGKGATLRTCTGPVDRVTAARNAAWKRAATAVGATWVDVHDWLCADGVCPIVVGNVIVYTDRHHLTRTFAAALEPELAAALKL